MRKSNSDSGKIRQVLVNAGYDVARNCLIYSESRKNFRRVKVWRLLVKSNDLFKIAQELSEVFGDRFLSAYNSQAATYQPWAAPISFAVKLRPFAK